MNYPFFILLGLVLFWIIIPPLISISIDMLRRGHKRLKLEHKQWIWAYIFIGVSLAWTTFFLFYPLGTAIYQSFTNFSLSNASATRWVGLRNYTKTLMDPFWWKTLRVTAIYIAGTLPMSIAISMFLAVQILKQRPRVQTFFKAALYLPGVISPVVSAAIMKWIFHPGNGFANAVMDLLDGACQTIGLPIRLEHHNWFADQNLAMPVLIVMSWLSANGVGVIIYAAAIGNIPTTYYEVAKLDGASRLRQFLHVTWPLVKPTTVFVMITSLIGGFQVFAPALLITGGGPLQRTYFLNYHIYRTFYYDNNFGLASAMAVMLMILIVIISVINYRWLATDVEY